MTEKNARRGRRRTDVSAESVDFSIDKEHLGVNDPSDSKSDHHQTIQFNQEDINADSEVPESTNIMQPELSGVATDYPENSTVSREVSLDNDGSDLPVVALSPSAKLSGSIDSLSDNGISGWLILDGQPSHRCVVILQEDGRVLSRTVACHFRADVLAAGYGDGCYGFTLPLPRSLLDGTEHILEVREEQTEDLFTGQPIRWRSGAGTSGLDGVLSVESGEISVPEHGKARQRPVVGAPVEDGLMQPPSRESWGGEDRPIGPRLRSLNQGGDRSGTLCLFDVSDLVYYLGHHPNLTGIQRVPSSIVLSVVAFELLPPSSVVFLSYNAKSRRWGAIPTGFLISLLKDLMLPEAQRLVTFPAKEASHGWLPGARDFDGVGEIDDGRPSVLCLLGAAWVQQDYFRRVLELKRNFGTRFVMMIHDLIPIYARESCEQGTTRVFEGFLRRALRHVDHVLCVSEYTANDLRRFAASMGFAEPPVTVTRNGSSFDEFMPKRRSLRAARLDNVPERFVLFVSTIEGRKNHRLIFDIWRRMVEDGDNPPHLVCVGRVGWRSESFVSDVIETNRLDGRIVLLQDVDDEQLSLLYERCLFTVYPSFYEGWGLPVGESLAAGKICVSSDRSSIPEVAGDLGVYINIDDFEQAHRTVRNLIVDDVSRLRIETKIRDSYKPITWRSVAEAVVAASLLAERVEWTAPYPFPAVPYSLETTFAHLNKDADGMTTGDALMTHIVDVRRSHFLPAALREDSFLRGEDMRAAGIWAAPENWGSWLCGGGGEVACGLGPDESSLYCVFLRLRVSGPASRISLTISANGESVWTGNIGEKSKDIFFHVRRQATNAKSWWQLRISVTGMLSEEQKVEILRIDNRLPFIGFEKLLIVPENDLKTRLDVITKTLMT